MKLPKGCPNDVVLRTWMAQGRGKNSDVKATGFTTPMWKRSPDAYPHVVTLSIRPFRTTNLSVDSFMTAHSPRRNCANNQKLTLKPLELQQRNCSTNTTFGNGTLGLSARSSSTAQERISQDRNKPERPHSNASHQSSQERKVSASVVTLGDYHSNTPKQYVPESLYTLRNNSFHPPQRFCQATGQKVTIGNTFGFNYHQGYINLLQQHSGIIATGTPVHTIDHKPMQTKPLSRWQSKNVVNEKVSKYPDPMIGPSPSFQARMTEIAQHEIDTSKWEKSKKGKKKYASNS